jgi:hypothetical protein
MVIDMVIYHIDMVILDIDMRDEANDVGDDSIDTVISHIDMGYLVTLHPTEAASGVEHGQERVHSDEHGRAERAHCI